MNALKTVITSLTLIASTSHLAVAADYEGAESRKGSTRGEACEKAKNSAGLRAKAVGSKVNTINTGPCECDKVSNSGNYGWECTVSWEANLKRERH